MSIVNYQTRLTTPAAESSATSGSFRFPPAIIGLGMACVDTLAVVDHFPAPDEKMRTTSSAQLAGGNTGNVLSHLTRLGLSTLYVGCVADDDIGRRIIATLETDQIPCSLTFRGTRSPSSFIIVDSSAHTRTILHTPSDHVIAPGDLAVADVEALRELKLIFTDGRNARAVSAFLHSARELLKTANLTIPFMTVVEAEAWKEGIEDLLLEGDYVLPSQVFLKQLAGRENQDASDLLHLMVALLNRPKMKCRWVITTLGKDGCVMLTRENPLAAPCAKRSSVPSPTIGGGRSAPSLCALEYSPNSTVARFADVMALKPVSSTGPYPTAVVSELRKPTSTAAAAEDADKIWVVRCSAWPIHPSSVVDSTGAGDAFNAGCIFALMHSLCVPKMLRFGNYTAARTVQVLGARHGVPLLDEIVKMGWLN